MIKIIEELPKLTIESVLQGNYLFIPEKTSRYHDKTSSYKNRAEERKKTFLELLKLAKGMEEMYNQPPTVPQLIELYAKHRKKSDPSVLRKMSTVTSTAERWTNGKNGFAYFILHGNFPIENRYYIEFVETGIPPKYPFLLPEYKHYIEIHPDKNSIEEMIDLMPEIPEESAAYEIVTKSREEIRRYKQYLDLARIGYKSTLKSMESLSRSGIEIIIKRPTPTEYNSRILPLFAQIIFGEKEIRYSFFPEEPVSLLLPKKQK